MKTIHELALAGLLGALLCLSGCGPPRPNLSEHQVDELLGLPAEAATASRQLVEHDARSREAMINLHADVQAEMAEIGRRQDQLDEDRKDLAAQRRIDPIIATAIETSGLLAACLLPLIVLAVLLWRMQPQADADAVCDYLVTEVINSADAPKLGVKQSQAVCLKRQPEPSDMTEPCEG